MKLKKMKILDQLDKMGKKTETSSQEKKLKYEISVLKGEIMHEKENKKKVCAELEKYKNRYKLYNFNPENCKIYPVFES